MSKLSIPSILAGASLLLTCSSAPVDQPTAEQERAEEHLVYIGTYTRETSEGIYVCRFDAATGRVTEPQLAAESPQPSFLAVHPNRRFLYAVNETNDYEGEQSGSVQAFEIDPATGTLTLLNQASSRGGSPCHLNVDRTGETLVVANYRGGSVVAFPVKQDGSLGDLSSLVQHQGSSVHPSRQTGPHAHSVDYSPDNRFVVAADLGLDQVRVYRVDPTNASLTTSRPPFVEVNPGAGPRHFAFHPSGAFAYVLNELQSTVTAFRYNASQGTLETLETVSMLPEGFEGDNTGAEIEVHPSGKFVYASNRGHDSLAVFAIDPDKGTLTRVENTSTQGKRPRSFGIHPGGAYLFAANQETDNVVLFRIDPQTGRLTSTGAELSVDSPVCIKFVPLASR